MTQFRVAHGCILPIVLPGSNQPYNFVEGDLIPDEAAPEVIRRGLEKGYIVPASSVASALEGLAGAPQPLGDDGGSEIPPPPPVS